MKPKLKTFPDLEKAVEMVRTGQVRGAEDVVRIIMRCFTKRMLKYKANTKTKHLGGYSPKFKNTRGCAIELVRNIYRFHNLR